MLSIRPEKELEPSLKKLIGEAFQEAVKDITADERVYISCRIDEKLRLTSQSRTRWVRELARTCTTLYSMYMDSVKGEICLSQECQNLLVAALFYFVNPYDFIPDHTPARGFLDDAYVIDLCIKELTKRAPETTNWYFDSGV